VIVVRVALRLLLGGLLAWWVAAAIVSPGMPRAASAAATAIAILTLGRAEWGLLAVIAMAPAGALLAATPARAAEMFALAFLAAWLLRIPQPLWARHTPGVVPAVLYGLALFGSWLALSLGASAGVDSAALPRFLLWLIPPDHLVHSSPQAETWTMLQALAGAGVFLAAAGIGSRRPGVPRRASAALCVSLAALGIASLVSLAVQWSGTGFDLAFLARYVRGERFAIHIADWNAAGSLYLLAGLAAVVLALADTRRRLLWVVTGGAIFPAFLLTGSMSAQVAAVLTAALVALPLARRRGWTLTRAQVLAIAGILLIVSVGGAVFAAGRAEGRATPAQAASMRAQFTETSLRMFESAPLLGVGTGQYYDRSAEFMPAALRSFYGNENAHNYFAQVFAELGVVGGVLFMWLIAAVLIHGWRSARSPDADAAMLGLFAGIAGYLMTAITGHPMLVSEAALPFWATCGVIAGRGVAARRPGLPLVPLAAAVAVLAAIVINTSQAARAAAATLVQPADQGFHQLETAPSGRQFRWMTRHGVSYIPAGTGVLRIRVSAPDNRPLPRPMTVDVALAGRHVAQRVLHNPQWERIDISVRDAGAGPFRRLDIRADQVWLEEVTLGERLASRPVSLMVESIVWVPVS
jgi:O-antigen ligase